VKINLKVKKIGINGEGIGYYKRKPVFVYDLLENEEAVVELVENKVNYYLAKKKEIIKKSDKRVKPLCKSYNSCNACSLQHCNYLQQLEIKKNLVKEALLKYADIQLDDLTIHPSDKQYYYRNAMKLPLTTYNNKLVCATYKQNSNQKIAINNCPIHEKEIESLKKEILNILNKNKCSLYDSKKKEGYRYLFIRHLQDYYQICLITGKNKIKQDIIDDINKLSKNISLYQCINTKKDIRELLDGELVLLMGEEKIKFKYLDDNFYLSPRSFFQLNTNQAYKLYDIVSNLIVDKKKLIVEAYAGIGLLSYCLKKKSERIIAIEIVEDAVKDGIKNAQKNKVDNINFVYGDAGKKLKEISKKEKIDLLVIDPPRSGIDKVMIESIRKSKVKELIYVSCNPASFAKNINDLKEYELIKIESLDMFPQTGNVEIIAQLRRKNG